MSTVSSASSSNVSYASQKSYYSKLDADQDGKVTKDEFVSGRPKNVTAKQASTLYSKIDTENTGSITEDQLNEGMDSNRPSTGIESLLSSDAMAVLMLMSQQGGMSFDSGSEGSDTGASGGMASISDLYAEMDSDGDGSVSKAEFVSSRPDDMSEDDANTLFASIDTEGTGSITEDQLAESMQPPAGPPPGGMPPQGAGGAQSSDEVYDALDTNQDGVVTETEFLAGKPDDVTAQQASDLYDSIDTEGTGSITKDQLSDFLNGTTDETDDATTELDLSGLASNYSANASSGIDDLLDMLDSLKSDA